MIILPRRLLIGALIMLFLFSSACNLRAQTTPVPSETILPDELSTATPLPTSTATSTPGNETPAVYIPITGADVISLQCQFCVNEEVHAVLVMSALASFNVSEPAAGVTCLTAQEVNDRRILLCRGSEQTTFNLNVCADNSNCMQFPVTLQPCSPILQTSTGIPAITFTPRTPRTPSPPQQPRVPTQPGSVPSPTAETTTAPPAPTEVTIVAPVFSTQITAPPASTPTEIE